MNPAGQSSPTLDRREWLRWLMASPLLPLEDLLSPLDFEAQAKLTIPPAHFGYLATGVDDDVTLRANREGFARLYLRPRRMVDISRTSSEINIFGQTWKSPILLAPAGSQRAYHAEGELAVARAANAQGHLQILSTVTSTPIEDVAKAHTRKIWYQLYPTDRWANTEKLVRRAEASDCPVLVLTVDTQGGRNTETEARAKKLDSRPCAACHNAPKGYIMTREKPMFAGLDVMNARMHDPAQTWAVVAKLRALTKMKLVIKGIETAEDAKLCVENGVDGLVVSNHGGRTVDSSRATIECLPEIAAEVKGKLLLLMDGGVRRGTDVFKALALGADAVCIGRPYLWALGAYGQAGVERVLDMLSRELLLAMRQCGTPTLAAITPRHVGRHERPI
jgi:isopentenyl diphosphate isomerase/L-lactate dehydrogenase-like FMN-dependent dehydrogenase